MYDYTFAADNGSKRVLRDLKKKRFMDDDVRPQVGKKYDCI